MRILQYFNFLLQNAAYANHILVVAPAMQGPERRHVDDGYTRWVWPCLPWSRWLSTPLPPPPLDAKTPVGRSGLVPGENGGVEWGDVAVEESALLLAEWPWQTLHPGEVSPILVG